MPRTAVGVGSSFYTVDPCRLVDTRSDAPLLAGTPRVFAVTGACDVPATAKALAVNLTVVGASASGHLQIFATTTPPPETSAISFNSGAPRANNAFVQLAAGGFSALLEIAGGEAGSAHLVVDVSGWFE
jgi:hypothetical protein